MNNNQDKLIFAPLIRVSTERQEKRGESLITQRKMLEEDISRLGGDVFRWYAGQEHATPDQERKILSELMRDAAEKKFDAIIVCDISRWSRDNKMNKEYLKILKNNRIRFFTGTTEHNLFDSSQSFFIGMNVEMGEYFANDQAQRSIRNRIERAKKGHPSCGKMPFGRVFDKKTKTWAIDEQKKKLILEIAQTYLEENIGFEELGQRFKMNPSNLAKILSKRCGEIWEQRFRNKTCNIDETVPTKVPPLLDEIIIQRIRQKAESRKSYNHGVYKYEYLFSRIIFDANTGYALSGTPNADGKRYYKPYRGSNAHRYMVNADVLEEAVLGDLFNMLGCADALQKSIFEGNPIGKDENNLKDKLEKLRQERGLTEKKIRNLASAIKEYDGTEMRAFLQDLEQDIKNLNQRHEDLKFQIQTTENQLNTLPTASEIETMSKDIRKWQLRKQVTESYLFGGGPFHHLPFIEKKKVISLIFGGKDRFGKKFGIFIKPINGKPRRYAYEAYGRFGFIRGSVEARSGEYSSSSRRISHSFKNDISLNDNIVTIVLNEHPGLVMPQPRIKEHILSLDQDQPLRDAAFPQAFFDLAGDVDKGPPGRDLKPQFFSITFHGLRSSPGFS